MSGTPDAQRPAPSVTRSALVTYPGARRPDRRRSVDRRRHRGWPSGSGATPTRRRSCSPTAGSTSPAPTTCSPRCWPTPGGGWWRGTSGATATRRTPTSTAGRPTSATPSPCSTPSAPAPLPVLGHSKGGSLMLQLADAAPAPGQPPGQPRRPAVGPVAGPTCPSTTAPGCCGGELDGWLDHRRRAGAPRSAARARSTSWPSAGAG